MSTTELAWFKSTYSSSSGDDCIEVALAWQKSSYSSGSGDDCVEVAACPEAVHVRDSKDKTGPNLTFSASAWSEFLAYVQQF
ncbi:DUF397 domain-containing protein [Streptomyces sp. PTM05]|uniref:DUF397 domain-containing protein n=1 Tax=Streptantibioticus parmotrematis TaxID=2873249 RepID=A0ABS7R3K4_9ACTN|nr:DUF397 domain-containing protein [Streptantibioticus parmotrematis]MBY8888629.1 DUF397 domain-containing protein [Streptantibioticus parmotrematis]